MPSCTPEELFVASSIRESDLAALEIARWADQNGYQPLQNSNELTYFPFGGSPRAWHVLRLIQNSSNTER
jgi:hypothetical protein